MLADIILSIAAPKDRNVTRTNDTEMAIVTHWDDNPSNGTGPAPCRFRSAASAVTAHKKGGCPEGDTRLPCVSGLEAAQDCPTPLARERNGRGACRRRLDVGEGTVRRTEAQRERE